MDRDRSPEPASAACHDAGSPGEPRAAAPRRSGCSAAAACLPGRCRRHHRQPARLEPVEHRPAASSYPDASRSCRGPPAAWRVHHWLAHAGAGASGASARRAPCGRRGCAGNGALPLVESPFAQRANRHGRNSAGRGRSGCTAAPACGNAHTPTDGRGGRPCQAPREGSRGRRRAARHCTGRIRPAMQHWHPHPLHTGAV